MTLLYEVVPGTIADTSRISRFAWCKRVRYFSPVIQVVGNDLGHRRRWPVLNAGCKNRSQHLVGSDARVE